jgi:hypothetical protein
MGIFSFRDDYQVSPQSKTATYTGTGVTAGVVKKVYLEFGEQPNGRTIIPGTIEVECYGKTKSTKIIAYPESELFLDIPLVTEIVDVYYNGVVSVYRRVNLNKTINNGGTEAGTKTASTPQTGISNFKSFGGVIGALAGAGGSFGSYFKKKPIHRLKLYEGDTVIQSKFGQSIRLSGYNNKGNDFNPKLIIRNKEASKFNLLPVSSLVEEDLNRDGSTIMMSSGTDKINFIPGTPDLLGSSDFKNRPDKSSKFVYVGKDDEYGFEAYPKVYDGEQCIISSDRLVFSSRKNETIFWSKSHYGVITDGIFSVDAERGININSKMPIDIQAFNNQINFYIGDSGEINLGNKNLKPAVDGILLRGFLEDLIRLIVNLRNGGLLTPAGPVSGMKQEVVTEFEELAGKLSNMLSNRVKIQF